MHPGIDVAASEEAVTGIPFGERLRQRALAEPDLLALTMVSVDGTATGYTLGELDREPAGGRARSRRGVHTWGPWWGLRSPIPSSSS